MEVPTVGVVAGSPPSPLPLPAPCLGGSPPSAHISLICAVVCETLGICVPTTWNE